MDTLLGGKVRALGWAEPRLPLKRFQLKLAGEGMLTGRLARQPVDGDSTFPSFPVLRVAKSLPTAASTVAPAD